jgi:carbon storage regulator CsrA
MLVLTRKQRQQITIGDNITITVLRVKGQAVRIGIEAPDGVRILRSELNAIDKAFEDESLFEEMPVADGALRTENNDRRSRLGKESQTKVNHPLSSPVGKQRMSTKVTPVANMPSAPVSLLSFR